MSEGSHLIRMLVYLSERERSAGRACMSCAGTFICLRGSYGHTSGFNACDQSFSGGFRDVGSVISFELIAVRGDCSRFVPVRALQLQAATC
nr:MAG TPA: hypothetical protein [Caudoviricetes sp.]